MPKSLHMWRKDLGFQFQQTIQNLCSMDHCPQGRVTSAGNCPGGMMLHFTQGLPAPRNSPGWDPWRRSEENAGSRKWWDSSGSQKQRPEGPEEKASSIHLMTIPYTENVPSALEILIFETQYITGQLFDASRFEEFKSISQFLIPIQLGQARHFKWLPRWFLESS